MPFVGFQCILHDSAILFSVSQSSLKLKREAKILEGGRQFCKMAELFGSLFYVLILEIWMMQILCHWSQFNTIYMMQQFVSQFYKISAN